MKKNQSFIRKFQIFGTQIPKSFSQFNVLYFIENLEMYKTIMPWLMCNYNFTLKKQKRQSS